MRKYRNSMVGVAALMGVSAMMELRRMSDGQRPAAPEPLALEPVSQKYLPEVLEEARLKRERKARKKKFLQEQTEITERETEKTKK